MNEIKIISSKGLPKYNVTRLQYKVVFTFYDGRMIYSAT